MPYPLFLYELRYVHSPVTPGLTATTNEEPILQEPIENIVAY
jgi:hypothetical protein